MNTITLNVSGFYLILLTLSILSVEIVANRWIRKVTNTYWFWLVWGIAYIVYGIVISWANHWNAYVHIVLPPDTPLSSYQSSIVSNAFLLNVCPFLNFALPLTLIADPSRKATRALSPIAMIASAMVIFLDLPTNSQTEFTLRFIFIGKPDATDLYYFGHAMNMFISMAVILNTPKFGWKGMISTYSTLSGFYLYVILVSRLTHCQYQVSGMCLTDFTHDGTYHVFADVLGTPPAISALLFFSFFISLIFGTIIAIDTSKKGYIGYGDKYSGCWWQWYDYNNINIKEPWGWFSRNWQAKHQKPSSLK